MKQNKRIYGNVTATSMRDEGPGSGKRCGYCLVISLSLLLFFSLMANALLTCFYFKVKWASNTEQNRTFSAGDCKTKHVTVTSPEQIRRCSARERQIQYKDRLYVFPTDEMSWLSSRGSCQELGGDLVIINSKEEHKFLVGAMNTFSNSLHWIGLRNEGRWLWVDETPLMQNLSWWKYTSEDTLEDSASEREDCVGYYDGEWVDLSCSTSERRICEIICTH